MVYDFKINRILFYVGWIGYLLMVPVLLYVVELQVFQVILFGFIFIFGLRIIMRRNTSRAYQAMHQKLYIYGEAKEHLEAVESIYMRPPSTKRIFQAVRLQNYAMANVFAGDFETAKNVHDELKENYKESYENQPSMRFSSALIDVLVHLFQYDKALFEEAFNHLQSELESLQEQHRENVKNNPYSVYYMINLTKHFIDQKNLSISDVESELLDKGEFLKTCVLYTLYTNGFLSSSDTTTITRSETNTLFYKDETRGY